MKKPELIEEIANETGLSTKDAGNAVNAFIDIVSEELKRGGEVQITGFGSFKVSDIAAHEGRNPRTGEIIEVNATKTPKFKAGKALKDFVNDKK